MADDKNDRIDQFEVTPVVPTKKTDGEKVPPVNPVKKPVSAGGENKPKREIPTFTVEAGPTAGPRTQKPRTGTEAPVNKTAPQKTAGNTAARPERAVTHRQSYLDDATGGTFTVETVRGDRARNEQTAEEKQRRREEKTAKEARRAEETERRYREVEESTGIFVKRTKPRSYLISLLITMFRMTVVCLLIIGFSGIGFVLGMAKSYLDTVPELDIDSVIEQDQSTILYDVNGNVLGSYYNMENREWASLEEIPEDLQNAVIAIEDVRFRRHLGIDFKRIFGVAISNLTSGSMQGGSTITQQLIKNTMLSFEQTYKRKLQEASLALELERKYSKDIILEYYLNTIYMGGSCYGVKTAARDYFDKELSELSLRECACLAGMIQNPSRYNPRSNYYSRSNPARTDNRTNLVLYEMCENGLITQDRYAEAKADTFTVPESSPYSSDTSLLYYTDYMIDNVVDKIRISRGLEDTNAVASAIRKEIRTEGYRIYTTLDTEKQRIAEEAVYNYDNYPTMLYSTDNYTVVGQNPDGSVIRLIQPQVSVSVVDYHNGYIVALVGGRQAPTGSRQLNRATQSAQPVGSSIKPLTVYGPAIELGAGIGSIYYDVAAPLNGWTGGNGYPQNNNRSFAGRTTVRKCIVNSTNVTAAQALLYDVTVERAYQYLKDLNVTMDKINKTPAGLALGTSGITTLDMAGAYTAFANMGVYVEPITFTKVEDKDGNVVLDMLAMQDKHRVYSESTAWQIIDCMRSVGEATSSASVKGQTVYGKTGTVSEHRGAFFAGFTGYYIGMVWLGSDNYRPLPDSVGGTSGAAPIFSAVMTPLHAGLENKKATDVDPETIGVVKMKYCDISGKRATDACQKTHTEYGNPENIPDCDLHKLVKICSASGKQVTQYCPEEECTETVIITVPQSGYLRDLYLNNYKLFVNTVGGAPTMQVSSCNVHTEFGTITPTPDAEGTPDPQATNVPEMTQPPTQ